MVYTEVLFVLASESAVRRTVEECPWTTTVSAPSPAPSTTNRRRGRFTARLQPSYINPFNTRRQLFDSYKKGVLLIQRLG